jgi:hypothetical protein
MILQRTNPANVRIDEYGGAEENYNLLKGDNMKVQIEAIKNYLVKNKKVYIAVGVGIVIGATVTILVIKFKIKSEVKIIQKIYQIAWRPENNQVIVNLVEKSTPSKPVHLVGTKLFFNSLNEASRETGYSLTQISKNVNGIIPDVKGDVFELLKHV